ncbi:hypothetical protein F5Y05DRAFT_365692 [Hypoxylon sp. FL0543]|nr:hypothetical protein F5Y05DRAFT_365692 [Hypoxylon sp. FL0543]
MHYLPTGRRFIHLAAVALFLITLLTTQFSFSFREPLVVWTSTSEASPACQIWPGWQGSGSERLSYDTCRETTNSPLVGDVGVLGDPNQCLLASSRLEQYYSSPNSNWSEVRWGQVQRRCAAREYISPPPENPIDRVWRLPSASQDPEAPLEGGGGRVAVVLRTWDNYEYTEKRLAWLRALIAEVSLQRSGSYQVFFLVNVKDTDIQLEEDDAAYEQALIKFVPEEFRDMALLFNERTLKAWYPLVQEHGAQDQMYQALQIFSRKFKEYDFIWQLEMDLRFTGHVHDTLESAASFARAQSRRNLWERNGRFYIPDLHNNSYDEFSAAVDAEVGDRGVWGPVPTSEFTSQGPQPPSRTKWNWGVGEEADLISFMPMIDPVGTNWIYEDVIHGFADGVETPRRVAIVSITRSSRRLLQFVHEAQQNRGQWLVSEATLETFALLHGLKAVTVPHPIFFEGEMTAEELDAEVNKGPPHFKAGGLTPSMLYSKDGWVPGPWWQASYWFTGSSAENLWKAYVDRRRLPPMLLHPVKEK